MDNQGEGDPRGKGDEAPVNTQGDGSNRVLGEKTQQAKRMGFWGKAAALAGIFGATTFAGTGHVDDVFSAGKEAAGNTVTTGQKLAQSPTSPLEFAGDKARDAVKAGVNAIVSEEAKEGWEEHQLMGQPIEEGKIIKADLIPVIGPDQKPRPIVFHESPSLGSDELKPEKMHIDITKPVDGIEVYGGKVGEFSAKEGVDVSAWLKVQGTDEEGKQIDGYISGLSYKQVPEVTQQTQ